MVHVGGVAVRYQHDYTACSAWSPDWFLVAARAGGVGVGASAPCGAVLSMGSGECASSPVAAIAAGLGARVVPVSQETVRVSCCRWLIPVLPIIYVLCGIPGQVYMCLCWHPRVS